MTKKLFILFAALVTALTSTIPVQTVSAVVVPQNFYSDSNIQFYDPNACEGGAQTETSTSSALVGGNNAEKVWNFFIGKGLKPEQVAGIMGNMSQESGFNPKLHQVGGPAYGIIQWDPVAGNSMEWWIDKAKNTSEEWKSKLSGDKWALSTQLELVWWHMTDGITPRSLKFNMDDYKKINDAKEATTYFEDKVEGAGIPMMAKRWAAAKAALRKYGKTTPSATSTSGESAADPCGTCSEGPSGGDVDVVLDPGHSGTTINETDPDSGVKAQDSDNGQETKDAWRVSEKVREYLEEEGYTVKSTKTSEQDTVGLLKRAKIANDAKPTIAVSIHTTPGSFGSSSVGWVTPQEVGLYRKTGSNKKTFSNEEIAKKSDDYSKILVQSRKDEEGGVKVHRLDFTDRDLPATGNISIVQLFSKVPWVYNEVGQTGLNIDKYSNGIAKGIVEVLKSEGKESRGETTNSSSSDCGGAVSGDLSATVKAYAWSSYHAAPYIQRKPEWAKVADSTKSHYVGGTVRGVRGIDCGGFVTMTIRNSGIDPNYNKGKGATGSKSDENSQWGYLDKNWQKVSVSSTSDLQPGDVAINAGHTFLHVGEISGFNDVFASASYTTRADGGRAPMAGQGDAMTGAYNWYRKK